MKKLFSVLFMAAVMALQLVPARMEKLYYTATIKDPKTQIVEGSIRRSVEADIQQCETNLDLALEGFSLTWCRASETPDEADYIIDGKQYTINMRSRCWQEWEYAFVGRLVVDRKLTDEEVNSIRIVINGVDYTGKCEAGHEGRDDQTEIYFAIYIGKTDKNGIFDFRPFPDSPYFRMNVDLSPFYSGEGKTDTIVLDKDQFESNLILTNKSVELDWYKEVTGPAAKYERTINGRRYAFSMGEKLEPNTRYILLTELPVWGNVPRDSTDKVRLTLNGKDYTGQYLSMLRMGKYPETDLEFVIDLGETDGEGRLTRPVLPQTGDRVPLAALGGLIVLAGTAMILMVRRKKTEN